MSLARTVTVSLMLGITLAAGCASGPKTFVNEDPAADFSRYSTFGFPKRLGTDERPGYTSLLSKYLKAAATREMQARGYKLSDKPDLLIDFGVQTKEKIRTTSTPTMGAGYGGYYGYRGYGAWGGYETTVTQYTEGTLVIDLVDAGKNQLVWEALAQGRIRDETRNNLQQAVDGAVSLLFSKFPHYAPGARPPAESGS